MKFDDRVWQNVTAPGTSNFNFTGATTQTGAISFDTFMTTTGDYTVYKADNGVAWETGILTKQGDGTYARTVKRSTNSNNAVNFSSGLVAVVCDLPAWLIDNLNFLEESVASAATCSIGAVQTAAINITSTTTITSFGTGVNKLRIVRFAAALTLTHNATSLILPTAANITTAAGDSAIFTSDASSNWRCRTYLRADGRPLTIPSMVITPQGRITLQTAVPVMVTSQSAKTTIYYTPYNGNLVPIYDGTNMVPTVFSELSVLTTDTTKSAAAIGASKVNDWFIWNDAGTLRIGHGPDWTNDTTRSAGTALVMVNGIWLNNATITNGPAASRGTYVGTTRSNGSSQLDWTFGSSAAGGGAALLNVWNAYNRVLTTTNVVDSTVGYTYNSTTIRSADASTSNRVSFVMGLQTDAIAAGYGQFINSAASTAAVPVIGVALDSTTVTDKRAGFIPISAASQSMSLQVSHSYLPQLGAHFIQATEAELGAQVSTFNANTAYNGLTFTSMM